MGGAVRPQNSQARGGQWGQLGVRGRALEQDGLGLRQGIRWRGHSPRPLLPVCTLFPLRKHPSSLPQLSGLACPFPSISGPYPWRAAQPRCLPPKAASRVRAQATLLSVVLILTVSMVLILTVFPPSSLQVAPLSLVIACLGGWGWGSPFSSINGCQENTPSTDPAC